MVNVTCTDQIAGSGIAPFLPIPPDPKGVRLPFDVFLYVCRVPLLLVFALSYFAFLQFMPIGVLGRKASLWCILGVPGIWWIDLQIDGVKKGYAAHRYSLLLDSNAEVTQVLSKKQCPNPAAWLYHRIL